MSEQPRYQRVADAPESTDTAAVLALLMGIGGLVFCPVVAIGAWVYANSLLRQIEAGDLPPSNYNLVHLAKILGVIGSLILVVVSVVLVLAAAGIFGAALLNAPS